MGKGVTVPLFERTKPDRAGPAVLPWELGAPPVGGATISEAERDPDRHGARLTAAEKSGARPAPRAATARFLGHGNPLTSTVSVGWVRLTTR